MKWYVSGPGKAGPETRGRERVRSCGPRTDFEMSDFRTDAFPV